MSKWSRRAGASIALAAGMLGLSMAAGLAASPLSTASADADGAQATAVGVPGVVTLSQSQASIKPDQPAQASWTGASVLGTDVIGKDSSGWTGAASALGSIIDAVNGVTCQPEMAINPTTSVAACVALLPGGSDVATNFANGYGSILAGYAVVFQGENGYAATAAVLPSGAVVNRRCNAGSEGAAGLLELGTRAGADSTATDQFIGGAFASHPENCS